MVSICILNWNCLNTLKSIIGILKNTSIANQIIVYDQNSTDGSVEFLKSLNGVELILSQKNTGISHARNEMIKRCKYEYVLLLDSDIIPIVNSVECMVDFMNKNPEFAYVGYDFKNYTRNLDGATKFEKNIDRKEVCLLHSENKRKLCCNKKGKYYSYKIALTQYGIFKKSCLLECPFPEFYPFNKQGWGAEDDIVGMTIIDNNLGSAGMIKNRCYYHEAHSSKRILGKNVFYKRYVQRYSHLKYFEFFLTPEQKMQALKNKKIPETRLDLNKYYWKKQNLGDIATDYIFSKIFPFFKLEEKASNNLLMFGGTVFNHVKKAEEQFGANYKNILFFGVGLSNDKELFECFKYNIGKNLIIVPRGYKTMEVLNNNKVKCEEPLGDVLQLFLGTRSCKRSKTKKNMFIKDVFNPDLFPEPENSHTYRVGGFNKKKLENIPFLDLKTFLKQINKYDKVYSSQIHPFFISAVLGKPAFLFPKDYRAEDLCYFKSLKNYKGEYDLNFDDCKMLREEIFDNIREFIVSLFEKLLRHVI